MSKSQVVTASVPAPERNLAVSWGECIPLPELAEAAEAAAARSSQKQHQPTVLEAHLQS
ncbi:hypothetical protein TrVGV298_003137 [Trichoderma virens]|nr:hypothetical protein TrVGV298_003137 [Trichoderma virens]UKZ75431.1 hypothetical protein TrVFT333_003116 [Trichoderma virens FT-333]